MSTSLSNAPRGNADVGGSWKSALRRRVGVLLLVKLAALIALWSLFFSPEHRVHVTDHSMGRALGIDAPTSTAKELPDG